jgi:hydrogenase expression/formation protein HypC
MCLAIPAEVVQLLSSTHARVDVGGVQKDVSIALLEDVKPGDYVLIHVGHALTKIDAEEAARTLELFGEMIEAEKRSAE